MRAKYIGKVRDRNGYAVHLFYEYRGHEYMITDEHNGYSETLKEKHEAEQKRIDDIIKRVKNLVYLFWICYIESLGGKKTWTAGQNFLFGLAFLLWCMLYARLFFGWMTRANITSASKQKEF